MTASASGGGLIGEKIPEFVVPSQYIPKLLAAFRPVQQAVYADTWDRMPVGEFKITVQDGREFAVKFGDSGKNRLCYQLNGVQCVRDGPYLPAYDAPEPNVFRISECRAIERVIFSIRKEIATGEKVEDLDEQFAALEISAGLRPQKRLNARP